MSTGRDLLAQAQVSGGLVAASAGSGLVQTGRDGPEGSHRYACRHLLVRLVQNMNVADEWTLELHDCAKGAEGQVRHVYGCEADARAALACIYALSRHLGPLADRFGGPAELGRWDVHTYELSAADEHRLASLAGRPTVHPML